PYREARPTRQALAPRATAATTSAPLCTPPSTRTSARSPTASTAGGSTSSGVGARSSWRPPWLETTTASAPWSTTMRASSTCWMPLTSSGPDQLSRSHDRSRTVRLGSNIWLISSATVPSQEVREANTRGSVVSRLYHHHGGGRRPGRSPGSARGERQAVADIAQPGPGDRHVHGQDQGLIARRLGPLDQFLAGATVTPHIQLEPLAGGGRGGGHVLDGGRPQGRQRIGDGRPI